MTLGLKMKLPQFINIIINFAGILTRVKKLCSCDGAEVARKTFPIVDWLPRYDWGNDLPCDVIAGVTVAIMQIPQGKENKTQRGLCFCFLLFGRVCCSTCFWFTKSGQKRCEIYKYLFGINLEQFFRLIATKKFLAYCVFLKQIINLISLNLISK